MTQQVGDLYHTPDTSIFSSSTVFDKDGSPFQLETLFTPSSVVVLVFVRHWGCAACAEYIEALSKRLGQDELSKLGANVVVIGHGKHTLIPNYRGLFGHQSI